LPRDSVILCSFGDASSNHSTAQGAINAAAWASYQSSPMPIVFICEDNGIGISVRTPKGWISANYGNRPGLKYMACDGTDIADAIRGARDAVNFARERRKPVFLHMKTTRLMGHAGADIEAKYSSLEDIEGREASDPLLKTAAHILTLGVMSADEILVQYEDMRQRVERVAQAAFTRPKLETNIAKGADLPSIQALIKIGCERDGRKIPLNKMLNKTLAEIMLTYNKAFVFGEDVARKGGVYGVTLDLLKIFGPRRVQDTLLDEQTILGLAIGAAQNGFLPIPEIQFLAYLHNAEDQIRGEAATLSFFSNGQFANPMVIRIAGLGYQRGFGGHFHNDNSLTVLRDIPGIIVACPSNADDARRMLRGWITPLPMSAILKAVAPCKNILIVDECRKSGSVSEELMTRLVEHGLEKPIVRITGHDSFIPLGNAAYAMMPSIDSIIEAAEALCG